MSDKKRDNEPLEEELTPNDKMMLMFLAVENRETAHCIEDFEQYYKKHKEAEKLKEMMKPKPKRKTLRLQYIAVVAVLILVLAGAGYRLWITNVVDYQTYSQITVYSEFESIKKNFSYLPNLVPKTYMVLYSNQNDVYSEVIFENRSDSSKKIIFSESATKLTYDVDTEDTVLQDVRFKGIDGQWIGAFYTEKNEFRILVWQQNDLFYKLVTTDGEVDLIKIASSLKTVNSKEETQDEN